MFSDGLGKRWITGLLLGLILLTAAWLRVSGHNWDDGQRLNADDSYVAKIATRISVPPGTTPATLLDPQHSPLNPRTGGEFFVYGSLPLYLDRIGTSVAQAVTGDPWFSGLDGVLQTGRVLAGLADTLVVALVFFIAARLWGAGAGLIAATLYAGAILPIQIGHFYIVDPFMSLFMTATLAASVGYAQTGRRGWLVAAGLAAGLALACKVSAAPVLLVPLVAVVSRQSSVVSRQSSASEPAESRHATRITQHAIGIAGLLALLALAIGIGTLIGDPFAVLDAGSYIKVLGEQAAIQQGGIDQWFTRKYVGTLPVVYLWGQLMLLGVGPLVGLAGTLGLAVLFWRVVRGRRGVEGLVLLGAAAYFLSIAFVEIKWVRYLVPLVPYLCLFTVGLGSALIPPTTPQQSRAAEATDPAAGTRGRTRVGWGLLGILALSALAGGGAVSAIYHRPQTQVAASQWIFDKVPRGSRVGIEVTTIALPLPLPGRPVPRDTYRFVRLDPLTDRPSAEAAAVLRDQLAHSDYLVIDTTQAQRTVPRLPWRYPVQIRYYDLLFSGQLGFTPVYTATSYPTLFGLAIPDDGPAVDLSFMDSSHPPIRIFQRTRTLTDAEWATLFAPALAQPSTPSRQPPAR
jgi:hypothetical protein